MGRIGGGKGNKNAFLTGLVVGWEHKPTDTQLVSWVQYFQLLYINFASLTYTYFAQFHRAYHFIVSMIFHSHLHKTMNIIILQICALYCSKQITTVHQCTILYNSFDIQWLFCVVMLPFSLNDIDICLHLVTMDTPLRQITM